MPPLLSRRFRTQTKRGAARDRRVTAEVLIPKTPISDRDKLLYQRWLRDPSRIDVEGVDTAPGFRDERLPVNAKPRDVLTSATGANPNKPYSLRLKVVDLDNLITSHTVALDKDPRYPAGLQPRIRDRAASRLQIDMIAKNISADELILDRHTLDRGPMIIGPDNVIESGNGRTIALKRAQELNPEALAEYFVRVRQEAAAIGLATEGIAKPVLVRERLTDVDRVAFAAEANQATVLQMSTAEQALQDTKAISEHSISMLSINENQTVDGALQARANVGLGREFIRNLPGNERAALVDTKGKLNQAGLERLKAALFAKVYSGESGKRLTAAFTESLDPTVKQVENALFDSLPAMSKAEALISSGARAPDLSIANDIAQVVDVMARLKQQGVAAEDFIAQTTLFERELSPRQERLLLFFDRHGRSRKVLREFLAEYAAEVEASPDPAQGAFFGAARETKEGMIDRIIEETEGRGKASPRQAAFATA